MVVKRILRCFDLCTATAVNDEAHSNAEIRSSPNTKSAIAVNDEAHSNAEIRSSPNIKSATVDAQYVTIASSAMNNLLECPVCLTLMSPPIHQCPNGHTLCSNCKAKVCNICPICRQVLGSIRCLALEKVAETLGLPSSVRPYNCPYNETAKCCVTGDIQFLVAHLKDHHNIDVFDGCAFTIKYINLKYIIPNPENVHTWKLTVFNCFSHYFCLHFESFLLETVPVYMACVRFMGNDDDKANKFRYSLEVGGNGRKLTWQGVPRMIRDSCKAVRDSLDGLVIPKNMALFPPDGDMQELELKVELKVVGI
ncbi:E3 ubiquitin-protein ligase SINAT2-like [Cornus florida]|uniref:E3 ubiquitin-protein ligase SINAT2-like n=1 Tax=Cornus florida TaxID=4283 RepID=UPI00289E3856|nr:E3 ubiquitin-protein ligase SINAT2-like [Cornus florida]XP_059628838.1 E3 ubiquitin-protein ligase SINAT2-like [Cornus florida]